MGRTIYMHRMILGLEPGDPREGDHRSPADTLDNRRINLRVATPGQNQRNALLRKDSSTGLKGVSVHRDRYRAQIKIDGKRISLGVYKTAEAAHEAYRAAAIRMSGAFANDGRAEAA